MIPHKNANSPQPHSSQMSAVRSAWEQVKSASTEYLRISQELDQLVLTQTEFGSLQLPYPDNIDDISNLGKRRAFAFARFAEAVASYNRALGVEPRVGTEPSSKNDLTPREVQVLKLIAEGKSSKEVAQELGIAFKTAVCHRQRILDKLDAHNTADLTRAAMRQGLVEP